MTKIVLKHWAYLEGVSGAEQGYNGPNPYLHSSREARVKWADGYLDTIIERVKNGDAALPVKVEN
jgi:hypothetical protein